MQPFLRFCLLVLLDLSGVVLAFLGAYALRVQVLPWLTGCGTWFFPLSHFVPLIPLLLLVPLIFAYERLYARQREALLELVVVARALGMALLLGAVAIYFSRSQELFSRTVLFMTALLAIPLIPLLRWLGRRLMGCLPFLARPLVLFAAPQVCDRARDLVTPTLRPRGERLVAVLPWPPPGEGTKPPERPAPATQGALLWTEGMNLQGIESWLQHWEGQWGDIRLLPDGAFWKGSAVEAEVEGEWVMVRLSDRLLLPWNRWLKRGLDILVSSLLLLLLGPLFLALALWVRRDSPGSALYWQERFGRDGKRFRMAKFRTMYLDGDSRLSAFLDAHPERREEWETYRKLRGNDPRVTRAGGRLRRWSLDELPQLWHVWVGDMSLVGPRPYLPREESDLLQANRVIFRVRPGLTGLWQVRGRNALSFADRIRLDQFYVRNWSFGLDLVLLMRTLGVVLKGGGAF